MQQDFVERHIEDTRESVTPGLQAKWLRARYKEATQIVNRLNASQLVFCHTAICNLSCCVDTKRPMKSHLMTVQSQRFDEAQIKSFTIFDKHFHKILLLAFEDLPFLLAFRLLPVRSRICFLKAANSHIWYYIRNECDAIDTEQHLFFDNTLLSQLRREEKWCRADVVGHVWHVLRAVTLHFLWSDRNRCQFDGRQPTPALGVSRDLHNFSAHIQYLQRCLLTEDAIKRLFYVLE
ncbi:hypothetical protein Plhal703r1_c04g0021021 [Plasmopara halstedii]